jgi:hypothetical protein
MLAGNVLVLLGLWRDAALHAADPTLAARDGIFTLEHGGHALRFGGIGLITLGGALVLGGLGGAPGCRADGGLGWRCRSPPSWPWPWERPA